MFTRYLFLCLAFFAISATYAQKPGYVVLNEGDTLKGLVGIKQGFPSAPQSIYFGSSANAMNKEYSIGDCVAFAIGDDEYCRATVTMDMSYFTSIDLSILNEDSTQTQTVFLKRIYKGKNLSLFKYHNGDESGFFRSPNVKTHFFVQDPEKIQSLIMMYTYSPTRSVVYSFDLERGSKAMRQLRPVYRDQLRMYFDWIAEKKLRRKIDGSEYREDHLLKIIAEIDKKYQPPTN